MRVDMDEESYSGYFVFEMPVEVRTTQEEVQLWIWICRLESHSAPKREHMTSLHKLWLRRLMGRHTELAVSMGFFGGGGASSPFLVFFSI